MLYFPANWKKQRKKIIIENNGVAECDFARSLASLERMPRYRDNNDTDMVQFHHHTSNISGKSQIEGRYQANFETAPSCQGPDTKLDLDWSWTLPIICFKDIIVLYPDSIQLAFLFFSSCIPTNVATRKVLKIR